MFNFSDKIVMITGAAGALGQAVTQSFKEAGAGLILIDRSLERLRETFPGMESDPNTCLYIAADLTDVDSVNGAVKRAHSTFEKIDVLVNIAGGFKMGPRLHESSDEDWDFMMNLNARSVFMMCRAVIPHMQTQQQGKIVNVAARAALEGKAKMAPYIASKSVVMRLTESMAAELRDENINVNCILPGTIDTPANRKDMPNADFTRWVPPRALADTILFLASPAARAVHGAALPVYGLS